MDRWRFKPAAICPHCNRAVQALPLSWRELEILEALMEHETTTRIAEKLFVSQRTVGTHLSNLYRKTGTDSHVGLLKWALENRMLALAD